ncbi:RHS repeat domain-containing protein [Chryseobacterium sp. MEBOG07]|uniref:RHS repeat domain-containing protein n=1 Tax=Chryseobacterium sp. MEBOG07 TaxID=2879939 RepID=UPI001F1F6D14|nr:RHS repeat-associated core domain-containing protein [Chryseobacterium sp. MEBOG07]UKB78205.1 RHS repeat-associated core domain-containing protein [Chryseobacterium sp. MEBOG07]
MEHLCYQYKYDGRNRLVEKKLPGKGLEQMVYNKKDQVILYRDTVLKNGIANFSADQSWMFTKYDHFGRVVYTGITRDTNPRNTIQNTIDTQPADTFETRGGSLTLNGVSIEYGNTAYPTAIDKLLTVNYYDTYPQEAPVVSTVLGKEVLPQTTQNSMVSTKSFATASYVKNIENDGWTKSYTYYDKKGRALATHSFNHLGGYTKTESFLKFSGVPEYSLIEHKRSANDTKVNIKETFEYDHQERLVRHWNQVNGGAQELLSENLYNDLGQLQTKNVGNTTGSPLQSIKYAYNIRGWMTKLNDPANLQNKLFAYELRYNNPNNQFSGSARYNGNISQMSWITQNDAVLRNYSYEYDPLNRLKEGRFWDAMNLERGEYHEQLTYDLNGNIKSLLRRGKQLPGYTAPEVMDNLEYHYENGEQSNKLSYLKEIGTGNAISGYPLASGSTGSTISYDVNGNMTTELDKGISSIQYNYLNLPGKITQNSKVTDYTYRADGVKVRKVFGTETTDYLDGFQYTDSVLKFFPTAEGYFNVETGKYVYNYTDHLGNTRLSYAKNGGGTEIIEESNYYPFGLKHEGYNILTGNPIYKYKYSGKELQESGMYDYGARMYMPDLGRWGVIDPAAELGRRFSPYNYAFDNPIMFIDPDGMWPWPTWKQVKSFAGGFARGAGNAMKGIASTGVKYNPVTMSYSGMIDTYYAGKRVYGSYEKGGAKAAAREAGNILYESTGAKAIVSTAKGVAKGDPEAIGSAAVIVASGKALSKAGGMKTAAVAEVETSASSLSGSQLSKSQQKSIVGGGGAQRAAQYSSQWENASLSEMIQKIAPESQGTTTATGKTIYNNSETGLQVVYDNAGDYFRIEDTNLSGRRTYLDLDGNLPNNKTVNGRQQGRSQNEYNQVTHFNNID